MGFLMAHLSSVSTPTGGLLKLEIRICESWRTRSMPSSRQILQGVQARGLISISHIPLGEGRVLPNLLERTGPADISLVGHNAVAAMGTNNHLPALGTL